MDEPETIVIDSDSDEQEVEETDSEMDIEEIIPKSDLT